MKVNLATIPPLHVFDLATQMNKMGYLEQIYTAYPRSRIKGVPKNKIRSFPWLKVLSSVMNRLGFDYFQEPMNHLVIETFDRWMAASLKPCDVFHCLSSFGVKSHRVARQQYNALTVCVRGSTHILYQDELLAEEYTRWGLPYRPINPYIVEREIEEYDICDMILVPSTFSYQSFLEKGISSEKITKIPYGIDFNYFKPVPKKDQTFRVIYVGAMSVQKGILYLLEALAKLRLPNFELWLFGGLTNEIKPFLEKYSGSFRYFGFVPRADLYRYYSQGSVFVFPSIQDGFGVVLAQAMACGLPVIATTNTGARDLIDEGVEGFIIPIRDAEVIREKVLYLYEHPEVRNEMAIASVNRMHRMRGWDAYVVQLLQAYNQAFDQR